jgi:hypothetical protein
MTSIASIARALRTVLIEQAQLLAQQRGCVQRVRKFTGASLVQTMVFGFLQHPDATVEDLAQTAAGLGVHISPQALDRRWTPALADCLGACLARALRVLVTADAVAIPLLERFVGVYVLDSTTIRLPDALADVWRGCGGRTGCGTQAALKLHVGLDLCRGQLLGPILTDARVHDRRAEAGPLPAGSLRLTDLGYFSLDGLADLTRAGVFWLTRLKSQTHLVLADSTASALDGYLAQQHDDALDVTLALGTAARLPARLLAQRVPPAVAAERRRRLRAAAKREGRTPTRARLAVCDWLVLVTNAPVELLSLAEAIVLARARWQIELLFKLWKRHGGLATSRSAKPVRILGEVYAKLLALLIQHWVMLVGCWRTPNRSLVKAARTVRGYAVLLATNLPHLDRLIEALERLTTTLAAGCRQQPRRAAPSTWQLLLAVTEEA